MWSIRNSVCGNALLSLCLQLHAEDFANGNSLKKAIWENSFVWQEIWLSKKGGGKRSQGMSGALRSFITLGTFLGLTSS